MAVFVPRIEPRIKPRVEVNLDPSLQDRNAQIRDAMSQAYTPSSPLGAAAPARDVVGGYQANALPLEEGIVPPLSGGPKSYEEIRRQAGLDIVPKSNDYESVVNQSPITETSSPQDVARTLDNPFMAKEKQQLDTDANGAPIFDENTGSYKTRPVTNPELAQEQGRQLAGVRDFRATADRAALKSTDESGRLQPNEFAANLSHDVLSQSSETEGISPNDLGRKISTAADAVNQAASNVTVGMFLPDATTRRNGISAAESIFQDSGMDPEYIRQIAPVLPTYIGIATNKAIHQTMRERFQEEGSFVDARGNKLEDAAPEVAIVNAIYSSLSNALDRTGIKMPSDTIHEFASASFANEFDNGNLTWTQDHRGEWVAMATDKSKKLASGLQTLASALTGEETRSASSTVPLGLSTFDKPGASLSRNSMDSPRSEWGSANTTKDILGRISERVDTNALNSLKIRFKDVMDNNNFDQSKGYSESRFAKQFNMDRDSFNKLKKRVEEQEGFDSSNPQHVDTLDKQRDQHAREQIENKKAIVDRYIRAAEGTEGKLRYTHYSQSAANHRFVRNNFDTDILGSKDVIRDTLNFGKQGNVLPTHAFDIEQVNRLKDVAKSVFNSVGEARHKKLMDLPASDRAMLGLMENAVANYFGSTGPEGLRNKAIHALPEYDIIKQYTPEMGTHLAELGNKYIKWLTDPTSADEAFLNQLAGMSRGENQSHQNLWYDFANLQANSLDPAKSKTHTGLTALNYDDGNQNGIMLQALFSGDAATAVRLGSYNPAQSDMRNHIKDVIYDQLGTLLADKDGHLQGWHDFLDAATEKYGDKFASDFLKAPLMEKSYGKDAGMFYSNVLDLLDDPKYSQLYEDAVGHKYTSSTAAARDLNLALEGALRKSVDGTLTKNLGRLGTMFAALNTVPNHQGITGDTAYYSTRDVGYNYDPEKTVRGVDAEGDRVKQMMFDTNNWELREGNLQVATGSSQLNPTHAKATQRFYNKATNKFDVFDNSMGSSLKRLMGVMPIQMADSALMQLMLQHANKGESVPHSVATVHDALITTMDTMHMYRNSYNNVAIPASIPEIAQIPSRLFVAYNKAKLATLDKVKDETHIGIGSTGEFPVVDAYFTQLARNVKSDSYKEMMTKRELDPIKAKAKWDKYTKEVNSVLREAFDNGWALNKPTLAVDAKQFESLINLMERENGFAKDFVINRPVKAGREIQTVKEWAMSSPTKVQQGYNELLNNENVRKYGIAQMTRGAAGTALSSYTPPIREQAPEVKAPVAPAPVAPEAVSVKKRSFADMMNTNSNEYVPPMSTSARYGSSDASKASAEYLEGKRKEEEYDAWRKQNGRQYRD